MQNKPMHPESGGTRPAGGTKLARAYFGRLRAGRTAGSDRGMNTAEYAVGTLAAVAFAGLLLKVVTSDAVRAGLTALFARALG